jgi:hypothetical protein
MGNVDIALPTDTTSVDTDSTDGIPVVSPPQESRSVLSKENETGSSLFSLTVLPAYGSPVRDTTANKTSRKAYKKPSTPAGCQRRLTWADVAKR